MEATDLLAYLPVIVFMMLSLFFLLLWRVKLASSWQWSAGFFQTGSGFALSTFPIEPHFDQLASGVLFVGAAYCYGSALMIHFGTDLRLSARRGLALAFLVPHAYFIFIDPNLRIVLFVIEMVFAALVFVAVISVADRAKEYADRFLVFTCVLIILDCLIRGIVFTFIYPTSEEMSDFVRSAYNFSVHVTTLTVCLLFPFAAISALSLQAVEKQRQAAARDPLTGLLNRRGFEAAVKDMTRAGVMRGSVLLVDIDHFKRINDGYGHDAGDRVIIEVARRLEKQSDHHLRLARFGGEEFVVLLGNTSEAAAAVWAETMRSELKDVGYAAGLPHEVSASFGVSEVDDLQHGLTAAIRKADAALYAAKKIGRDRVMLASATSTGSLRSGLTIVASG